MDLPLLNALWFTYLFQPSRAINIQVAIVTDLVPQIFSPEYYGWSFAKTFAFAPSKMMSTDGLNQGDENTHGPGDRFLWPIHCYNSSVGCDYMAALFQWFIKTLADLYH